MSKRLDIRDFESEAEYWEAFKEDRRKKRWQNRDNSLVILKERNVEFKLLDEKTGHYRVGRFDFWPTTGVFYCQSTKEKGRGVFELIKVLGPLKS